MKRILIALVLLTMGLTTMAQVLQKDMTVKSETKPIQLSHDTFKSEQSTVDLYYLAHGTVVVSLNDGNRIWWIYVDPVLRNGDKDIDYANLPVADIILYTHDHFDHISPDALEQHSDKHTVVYTAAACLPILDQFKHLAEVKSLANGESVRIKDVLTITAVPAYNTTKGRETFHPKGKGNGYMLTLNTKWTLYIAGDTEPIPEMAKFADKYDLQVALLPMNQPYTMTPDQVLQAAKMLRPRVLVPYHMGDTDLDKAAQMLKQLEGVKVRIREELR